MASDSSKLTAKLDTVNACLNELEAELTPLLAQSLPETAVNLSAIQQAKLHVLLPYLTNGLLFGVTCAILSSDYSDSIFSLLENTGHRP
jgi:exosome complex protein LRP1